MTPTESVSFIEEVLPTLWPNFRYNDRTADAWYTAGLKSVNWDDATQAATSLVRTQPFVSLAELMTEVRRIRENRLAQRPIPAPDPALSDNSEAYQIALQAKLKQVGDRLELDRKAIPRTGFGAAPSAEYNRYRGIDRDPLRVAAVQVRCPWEPCKAEIGAVCIDGNGKRLRQPAHDGRLVAAGLAEWRTINGIQRAMILAEQGEA